MEIHCKIILSQWFWYSGDVSHFKHHLMWKKGNNYYNKTDNKKAPSQRWRLLPRTKNVSWFCLIFLPKPWYKVTYIHSVFLIFDFIFHPRRKIRSERVTYLHPVSLVIARMLLPPFPMIAPTNSLRTRILKMKWDSILKKNPSGCLFSLSEYKNTLNSPAKSYLPVLYMLHVAWF